jgi:monomeric sarcosine oxidase
VKSTYSHIVIGAGIIGTATAYWLARSGAKDVLVLEQFELGHDKGASEDCSRIIRHFYNSLDYAQLTHSAYDHWSILEEETGLPLVTKTGGLDLAHRGTPGEAEMNVYKTTADSINLQYEEVNAAEIRRRWPQWRIGDDVVGIFQTDGGILNVRNANSAQIARARARDVEFAPRTTVLDLDSTEDRVTVTTDRGTVTAEHVVVCVASWIHTLLPSLGLKWNMYLSQEQVSFFATPNLRDFAPDRFPIWLFHAEDHLYYGFPIFGEVAVKLSRDFSGHLISSDERSYVPQREDTDMFRAFLQKYLPAAQGPEIAAKTCVYDLPPDRDFILDTVPGHPRVTVGLGAAHAAKFGNLLGHVLSDLALHGKTSFPIDGFRADRPSLTDPDYEVKFRLTH